MNERTADLLDKLKNGVVAAMATPLDESGYRVQVEEVKALVDFLLGAGIRGLFVGGTTGEGIVLESAQRRLLHEEALAATGERAPVLLHVGANTTAEAVALAEHASRLAATAMVAVAPTFYPVDDESLLRHFAALAEAAPETPLLIYDIPHMAINGISPSLLRRLAEELPTLAGVKSSRPDAQHIRALADAAPPGTAIYAGNERIALGSLALGASGLISGLATAIPEPFVRLTEAWGAGEIGAAQEQQRIINRLLDRMPEKARIGAIKLILEERGIAVGPAVPPRSVPPGLALWADMKRLL